MNRQYTLRRHGYHLMSLASVGATFAVLPGLMLASMPWMPAWNPQSLAWNIGGISWSQAVAMPPSGRWLPSLSALLGTLAYLAPLIALRRLGHRLYRNDALSRPVADAFRWLAHSLPIFALLRFAGSVLVAVAAEIGRVEQHSSLDLSGGYIFLIACLCLYSVAHLMQLASEADDDARSIV